MSFYFGRTRIKKVGTAFVAGDTSQVAPENIKAGVSILGTVGTFSSASTLGAGVSPATADQIVRTYGAFVDGVKIEGTLDVKTFYTGTSEPGADLGNNGDIYLKK